MTVEEMKQRKKELGYSNEKLSELSGVTGLERCRKVLAGKLPDLKHMKYFNCA